MILWLLTTSRCCLIDERKFSTKSFLREKHESLSMEISFSFSAFGNSIFHEKSHDFSMSFAFAKNLAFHFGFQHFRTLWLEFDENCLKQFLLCKKKEIIQKYQKRHYLESNRCICSELDFITQFPLQNNYEWMNEWMTRRTRSLGFTKTRQSRKSFHIFNDFINQSIILLVKMLGNEWQANVRPPVSYITSAITSSACKFECWETSTIQIMAFNPNTNNSNKIAIASQLFSH